MKHLTPNDSTIFTLIATALHFLLCSYHVQVTEANSLSTARRLQICEKSWSKLANHFTIVLSDRDTVQLSELQVTYDHSVGIIIALKHTHTHTHTHTPTPTCQ